MVYNVSYSNPVENVSYYDKVDLAEAFEKSYVYYQKDQYSDISFGLGPRLYKFPLEIVEELQVNEIFGKFIQLLKETTDQVSVGELFSFYLAAEILNVRTDFIRTGEVFSEEFKPALREFTTEQLTVLEAFTETFKPAFREFPIDALNIDEIFTETFKSAIRESTTDSIAISEIFSQRIQGKTTILQSEIVSVDEIFTQQLRSAIREAVTDNVVVSEDFAFRFAQAINNFTSDSVFVAETFAFSLVESINIATSDLVSVDETFSLQYFPGTISPPRFPIAAEQPGGSIELTWTEPITGNPESYEIQFIVNGGSWVVLTSSLQGTANSIVHSGCQVVYSSGDIVQYRIRAEIANDTSDWVNSNSVNVQTCIGPG